MEPPIPYLRSLATSSVGWMIVDQTLAPQLLRSHSKNRGVGASPIATRPMLEVVGHFGACQQHRALGGWLTARPILNISFSIYDIKKLQNSLLKYFTKCYKLIKTKISIMTSKRKVDNILALFGTFRLTL